MCARAIEQRDVFRIRGRARVREPAEPARAEIDDQAADRRLERPAIRGQVTEVEAVRLGRALVEDVVGARPLAGIDRRGGKEALIGQARRELGRIQANEHLIDVHRRRRPAREQPHLRLLGFGGRREVHLAVTAQHDAGDATR